MSKYDKDMTHDMNFILVALGGNLEFDGALPQETIADALGSLQSPVFVFQLGQGQIM